MEKVNENVYLNKKWNGKKLQKRLSKNMLVALKAVQWKLKAVELCGSIKMLQMIMERN